MTQACDYKYIERWGRMSGSYPGYIKAEQQRAAAENAPPDAVYRDSGSGTWQVTGDIQAPGTRAAIGLPPLDPASARVLAGWQATAVPMPDGGTEITFPAGIRAVLTWAVIHNVPDCRIRLSAGMTERLVSEPAVIGYTPAT